MPEKSLEELEREYNDLKIENDRIIRESELKHKIEIEKDRKFKNSGLGKVIKGIFG